MDCVHVTEVLFSEVGAPLVSSSLRVSGCLLSIRPCRFHEYRSKSCSIDRSSFSAVDFSQDILLRDLACRCIRVVNFLENRKFRSSLDTFYFRSTPVHDKFSLPCMPPYHSSNSRHNPCVELAWVSLPPARSCVFVGGVSQQASEHCHLHGRDVVRVLYQLPSVGQHTPIQVNLRIWLCCGVTACHVVAFFCWAFVRRAYSNSGDRTPIVQSSPRPSLSRNPAD